MTDLLLHLHPLEYVGLAGFGIYMLSFFALTVRLISGEGFGYFVLSLASALMILTGLSVTFNIPAAALQLYKVLMCVLAIGIRAWRLRAPVRPRRDPPAGPAPHLPRATFRPEWR